MNPLTFLSVLLLLCCLSCTSPSDNAEAAEPITAPVSDTEKAINQVVLDVYAALTFDKGTTPDYEAIKALFTPDARLYNLGGDSLEVFSLDGFITFFKTLVDEGEVLALKEMELGGETEYFGKIAHRVSASVSYYNESEEPTERGVNSFQLIQMDGKWLISSIIWDVEKEGQSIPEKYLSEK